MLGRSAAGNTEFRSPMHALWPFRESGVTEEAEGTYVLYTKPVNASAVSFSESILRSKRPDWRIAASGWEISLSNATGQCPFLNCDKDPTGASLEKIDHTNTQHHGGFLPKGRSRDWPCCLYGPILVFHRLDIWLGSRQGVAEQV